MNQENSQRKADVLVIGGGHAGVEAAAAAARVGAETLLVTKSRHDLGVMSCNPAFGGLGKGHLLRELDALDGLLARAADEAAIHYRLLGRARGWAVRGPRAQADRQIFATAVQECVAAQERLEVVEGAVRQLLLDDAGAVAGALLADGTKLLAGAVVLASGTFLGARIYCGDTEQVAGRKEELATSNRVNTTKARIQVNDQLRDWFAQQAETKPALQMIRLKTGTPPRLAADSLNYEALTPQAGDSEPCFLSFLTNALQAPQSHCYLTRTNPETHALVRQHLDDSAVGLQSDLGLGPRYCPSLEDKVVRFASRESHNVFLEPEGTPAVGDRAVGAPAVGDSAVGDSAAHQLPRGEATVYPNGISNALPPAVQEALVRTIAGLEQARIVRYGYAVSYNAFDPRGLGHDLQSQALPRLFLAGQINGTTGYEEAAAQGVLAGLNAARRASGQDGIELPRAESYIGVMVDDLVTRGVSEPYRMLTARAEFRLSLRADNADLRLTPKGEAWGLVGKQRSASFAARLHQLQAAKQALSAPPSTQGRGDGQGAGGAGLDASTSWASFTAQHPALAQLSALNAQTLEADLRYAPYLARQAREQKRLRRSAPLRIPPDFAYEAIAGLGHEACASLTKHRPPTLAAALVLEGVSPVAVSLLATHLQAQARSSTARAKKIKGETKNV